MKQHTAATDVGQQPLPNPTEPWDGDLQLPHPGRGLQRSPRCGQQTPALLISSRGAASFGVAPVGIVGWFAWAGCWVCVSDRTGPRWLMLGQVCAETIQDVLPLLFPLGGLGVNKNLPFPRTSRPWLLHWSQLQPGTCTLWYQRAAAPPLPRQDQQPLAWFPSLSLVRLPHRAELCLCPMDCAT